MTTKERLKEIIDAPVDEKDIVNGNVGSYFYKLCAKAYNLGLEVAAEEAEVDYFLEEDTCVHEVSKQSILKHKL